MWLGSWHTVRSSSQQKSPLVGDSLRLQIPASFSFSSCFFIVFYLEFINKKYLSELLHG